MKKFEGKTAVVIGGSGGIGKSIALMLYKNGADVVVQGQSAEKLAALKNEVNAITTVQHSFSSDSLKEFDHSPLSSYIEAADILCVCYGPFLQKSLEAMTFSEWIDTALLDYALPGALVSLVLPQMIKKKWGRILLFGGTGTSFRGEFKTNAAYAGAKTGVGVLTQSVAACYGSCGITCNCIMPGFVETEYISQAQKEELAKKMPAGKLIKADNIASAGEFLLSSQELNGVLLKMDSGWTPGI